MNAILVDRDELFALLEKKSLYVWLPKLKALMPVQKSFCVIWSDVKDINIVSVDIDCFKTDDQLPRSHRTVVNEDVGVPYIQLI